MKVLPFSPLVSNRNSQTIKLLLELNLFQQVINNNNRSGDKLIITE